MAAVKDEQIQEPDRCSGTPHPRECSVFIGHDEAEKAILEAFHQKRLHHAWLICGMEGIGKATLAYRIARFLLQDSYDHTQSRQSLNVALDVETLSSASRQINAQSHPNLGVLRRSVSQDNKVSSIINVDSVRKAMSLFETTAVGGRYRICIVDSADDLNNASANALLKLIEEPPQRSLFLLISNAPQKLLPTIRSRCRKLYLRPLNEEQVRNVIQTLGEPWTSIEPEKLDYAIRIGEGSVKRTIDMLRDDNLDLVRTVEDILNSLPRKNDKDVLALADRLSRKDSDNQLALALDMVQRWVGQHIAGVCSQTNLIEHSQLADLVPLTNIMAKVTHDLQTAAVYNLDRRPLILQLFDELAYAVKPMSR